MRSLGLNTHGGGDIGEGTVDTLRASTILSGLRGAAREVDAGDATVSPTSGQSAKQVKA